jgi:hypothetical protein
VFVSKYHYGPEERQKLLDKLNRIAANLGETETEETPEPEAAAGEDACAGPEANEISSNGWLVTGADCRAGWGWVKQGRG